MRRIFTLIGVLTLTLGFSSAFSQSYFPGKIVRASTASTLAQRQILNPNDDGFVSINTTTGWITDADDTSTAVSEIWYTPVKSYGGEPCCDLRRGPDHRFSDFVPDSKNNGVYLNWKEGTGDADSYLRIRMRMGTIIPGSKGFSLLIDTDGKFGATGANKDPNYVAKTTGINGNPGFELELVLETGFRVAIYNIDGLGNPSEGIDRQLQSANLAFYDNNWSDRSQVSMAATTEGGDPDYFIDWYVSLAELKSVKNNAGTTLVTSLLKDGTGQAFRIIPTTVMAPKPSTAGPISDMYGSSDSAGVINQPPVCLSCDRSKVCTAAPVLVSATSSSVTLYWVKANTSDSNYARIQLLKNGSAFGTPFKLQSGSSASTINLSTIGGGSFTTSDLITATAQSVTFDNATLLSDKAVSSNCFSSNSISLCSDATRPVTPVLLVGCNSGKGLTFTNYPAGYTVNFENLATGVSESSSGTATTNITFPSASQVFFYGGCSGSPMSPGFYKVTYSNNGCTSKPFTICNTGNGNPKLAGTTTTPIITFPNVAAGDSILRTTTTISGTAEVGATVYLNVDSVRIATATATGGNFTFTGLDLSAVSDTNIYVLSVLNTGTVSTSKCGVATRNYSIKCYNEPPTIMQDTVTKRQTVGEFITGFSNGNVGDSIMIYKLSSGGVRTTTPVAKAIVQSGGKWTSSYAAVLADFSYIATLKGKTSCTTESAVSGIDTVATVPPTPNLCSVTLSSVSASNNGSGGGSATFVNNGTVDSNVPLYSDATSISGTFKTTEFNAITPAGSQIRVNVLINGSVIATTTTSTVNWTVAFPTGSLYQGAIMQVSVVQLTSGGASGGFSETTCSTLKVTCSCAASHLPTTPVLVGNTTKTIQSGQSATFTISNPVDGYFYSVRNVATGKPLSKGISYTATSAPTSINGRLMAPNGDLSITTVPVTENTTAEIAATAIGGTESCTSSTQAAIVLPIILIEFKGQANQKENILTWKTASEINASHFVLEKSINGITFNQLAVIGVTGAAASYSYNDAIKDSVSYYRLRMVDLDGHYKFSNVIMLKSRGASVTLGTVRPNPFTSTLAFSIYLNRAQTVRYVLVDAAGRIVNKGNYEGVKGVNEIKLSGLDKLQSGLFTLRIMANETIYVEKLVK